MTDPVPSWVHMADVPPDTDEEPWTEPQPELPRYAGLAFAVVLIAALFLLALVVRGVPR